ncbi:T9SS type A sorting domain-containing protein [Nostoc sp. NIES-2111]
MPRSLSRFLFLWLALSLVQGLAWAQFDPIYNGRRYTSPDLDKSEKTVVRTLRNGDALLMRFNSPNTLAQPPARMGPVNIVRVDSNGHIRWSKQFLPATGDSSIFTFADAVELKSGKLILHTLSQWYNQCVILCLSADGDMLWCKKGAMPSAAIQYWIGNPLMGNMTPTSSQDGVWFMLPTDYLGTAFRIIRIDTLGQVQAAHRYRVPSWITTMPVGIMPSGNSLFIYAGGSTTYPEPDQLLAIRADAGGVPQQAIATPADTSQDRSLWVDLAVGRFPGKGAVIAGTWRRSNPDGERLMYVPQSLQYMDQIMLDSLSPGYRPDIYSVADGEEGVSVAGAFGHVFLDSSFRVKTVAYSDNAPSVIMLPAAGAGANRHYTTIGGFDTDESIANYYLQQQSLALVRLSNKGDRPSGFACGSTSIASPGLKRVRTPSAPFDLSAITHATDSYTLTSLNPVVRNFPLCEVDNCNWHFFFFDIDLVDSTGLPTRQYTFPNPFFASGGVRFNFSNGDTGRTVTLAIPSTVTCNITGPCGIYHFDIRIRSLPTALRYRQAAGRVTVAPNPASRSVHLYGLQTETKLCLLDAIGRKVLEKQVSPEQGISVEQLPRGVYQWQCAGQTGRLVLE